MPSMATSVRHLAVPLAALIAVKMLGRRWMADWGATTEELAAQLPGDELVEGSDLTSTRAVTVYARAADIWPWIAQLGQGRGGFYSYDALENLAGLRHPQRRSDRARMAGRRGRRRGQARRRAGPDRGRRRTRPVTRPARWGTDGPTRPSPFDFTWAFVLNEEPDGTTRLVSRERYEYLRWWSAFVVEPASLISFVMTRKMLRGIAERAERSVTAARAAA